MKLSIFQFASFLVLISALSCEGWTTQARIATSKAIAPDNVMFTHKASVEEIASELEELGDEMKKPVFQDALKAKKPVLQDARGMSEYKESLPHHLRLEIHELKTSLRTIEKTLEAYSVVWETAEVELQNERLDRKKEHESVRHLFGSAIKLMGRRVKNGIRRLLFLEVEEWNVMPLVPRLKKHDD